jgi:hypothetical protein
VSGRAGTDEAIRAAIAANVDKAPPLSKDQHDRLAWLFGDRPQRPARSKST